MNYLMDMAITKKDGAGFIIKTKGLKMIKKLTLQNDERILCEKDYMLALRYAQTTINQLVDAVNELQKNATISKMEKVEPADPYAEQRKCICKLCWFWNDDKADKVIGILTGVFDEADKPFERNINQTLYKHCEPVKPDDDIIYKGGDNE